MTDVFAELAEATWERETVIHVPDGSLSLATSGDADDPETIRRLMAWRVAASDAFVSRFVPSPEGTGVWLRGITARGSERLLFFAADAEGRRIGHMGLCRCAWNQRAVAVENVLRGEAGGPRFSDLLAGLADWVWRCAADAPLELDAFADMRGAIALYGRLGFKEVGRRPLWAQHQAGRVTWTDLPAGGAPREMVRYRLGPPTLNG